MTAPPDDLVAELEQLSMRGHPVAGRASWRIQRLTAENKALREMFWAAARSQPNFTLRIQQSALMEADSKAVIERNDDLSTGEVVFRALTAPGCLAAGAANADPS